MGDDHDAESETTNGGPLHDALYTAVGFAVLGFQRVNYARRQVELDVRARLRSATPETRAEVAGIVDSIDTTLERLSSELPRPLDEVASAAHIANRHIREQFIDPWVASPPADG